MLIEIHIYLNVKRSNCYCMSSRSFLIYFAEVEEFPLDLRILCEENPTNESVAVTTWKYSFYHRTESFFKKRICRRRFRSF